MLPFLTSTEVRLTLPSPPLGERVEKDWRGVAEPYPDPRIKSGEGEGVNQASLAEQISTLASYSTTLNTATAWLRPFSATSPISSSRVLSSTAVATRRPTRIWPSLASSHSRAARLVTVPIAV